MNLDKNELDQVFEGLAASGVRTMLWDSNDALIYADLRLEDLYKSNEFQKSFGKVELTAGMNWLDWTCLLYTSPSPRDGLLSRMPSSA